MPRVDIWMPIYIGDYLRDTEELSAAEHGSYLLLLMHYWMKNGEIGSDIDRLARVARTCDETCRFILGSYFELVDGNYKNKRADIEMRNAENRRVASRENGYKGGRPAKNNLQETGGLSVGIPSGNLDYNLQKSSSPSPSQEEREDTHTPREEKTGVVGEEVTFPPWPRPSFAGESAMPQAVFNAWAILGDRVIQPGDFATAFSARWSEMRRFVQGIHSDQVLAAIDNFGKITGAPPGRYFWNQRITLRAFLEKHLEKFLPANFREEDFLARTAQRPAPPGKVDDEKTRAAKRRIYGTEGI